MHSNPENDFRHSHQTLQVFLYYRIVLSGILFSMYIADVAPNILGVSNSVLYLYACVTYCIVAIASPFVFKASTLVQSQKRIHFLLMVDVAAQLSLIHASAGVDSGLGYLLIITIAMVNIFIRGQLAYGYAAFISVVLILESLYLYKNSEDLVRVVFASGTLGLLLFATTVALQYLTDRIRIASSEAETQARHIQNLQEIAQNIVTRMQTGVIVVDSEMRIELMNTAAKQMLDIPVKTKVYGEYLANLRELAPVLKSWESVLDKNEATVLRVRPGVDIRVNIAHLETGGIPKNIFYLEDYASIKQYAQQLKLASLGRLAARIAHEIRNPLGALSHAAQLLDESDAMSKTDRRMTEIIIGNSGRVNEIIENTLALSRRKEPNFEQINLAEWLPTYIDEAQVQTKQHIHLTITDNNLKTRFDLTHLRQVLSNLIDNGLRYSKEKTGEPWLSIEAGMMNSDEKPYIEIKDNGQGIPSDKISEIYEPFYTTNEKGSGLGLYICKELVEMNHASLHYKRTADNLSCFRVDFSHHQRMR